MLKIKIIISIIIIVGGVLFLMNRVIAPSPMQEVPTPLSGVTGTLSVPTTTLLAVGDIMLSRHVGFQIDQKNDPNLPFAELAPLLSAADIAFGNLECPLSESKVPIREGLIFRCLTKYVPGLVSTGIDVLSTANNHSFDQGLDNLGFTVEYLKSQGIAPVGTGRTFEEAHQGTSVSPPLQGGAKGGPAFGFLAYSYSAFNDGKRTAHPQIATTDIEQLKIDIANLKSNGAEVVIVSMHEGAEYQRQPNDQQIDFAHAAIDAGADIVIGHHPHWIQTMEIYSSPVSPPFQGGNAEGVVRKGLIFYSLGNFIFDQMWSVDTKEGLVVKLNFQGKTLRSAELIPVVIENFCCPRLASEKEKTAILKKINLDSGVLFFPSPSEGRD